MGNEAITSLGITEGAVEAWHAALGDFAPYTVARNAATSAGVRAAAKNPLPYRVYHDTYSVSLTPTGDVTNQRKSGRCWLFSALNVVRDRMMSTLGTTKLELSQAYLQFWDKLEKSASFLDEMIRLADRSIDDREVVYWLQEPASDGGWWDAAAALIDKYGVMPKACMPDTANSQATSDMDEVLFRKLRQCAMELRAAVAKGASAGELAQMKGAMLADVYRILAVSLGEPPARFTFEYVADARKSEEGEGASESNVASQADGTSQTSAAEPEAAKNTQSTSADSPAPGSPEALMTKKAKDSQPENFTRIEDVTPQEFFARYAGVRMSDFINLGNVPGQTRPYGSILQLEHQGSIAGVPIRMLNVPIDVLKDAVIAQLKAGHPAWMACDVLKNMDRSDPAGLLDTETLDYEALFGMTFDMDKATSFDARETELNHAMTFQGVNLDATGKPTAWRVENSWGKDACKDGYFIITDRWFDAYVGQAIVHRDYVPADIVAAWDDPATPVVHMDPWSPMFGLSD